MDAAERHRAADQGPEGRELQGEQKRPAVRGGMAPIIEQGTAAGIPSRACQEFDAPTMSSANAANGGMLPVAGDGSTYVEPNLLGYFDPGFDAYVGYDGADSYNEAGVLAGGQLFSDQLEDLGFGVG
ncbi:Glycoside hydrolase, family 47 [Metarhizium robertsii ARSEF 23]|nr:Glycoside hydrolase, family 47 [Metarhizium robertsii ARSEF 23]KHO11595.1 Glycoside hydrolase, family 47 [Metarhizium robertsii ARSEF 23]